ncbi:MAG: hypothetical protein N3F09_09830, partial [Bacteroidia bacterium]|nr:hypothetical protein [Bacteroidia bacterium]
MKTKYKLLLLISSLFALLNSNSVKAQMNCMTPPTLSLGVYDANTWGMISPTIPCTYTNLINVSPVQWSSGNNGTTPCIMLIAGPTNPNSQTNNSLTIHQGTSAVNALSICPSVPVPCPSFVPSSSMYSLSLFFVTPTLQTVYRLCNISTAASFNYTIKSCYSGPSSNFTTGTWFNSPANNCQTITIPANSPVGIASYTVSPAVPPSASVSFGNGDLFLDTYQMTAGVYTITYHFNSQGSPTSCTATATTTIMITNPFNPSWSQPSPQCTTNPCLNLPPYVTGSPGGTFVGTGVTSNSFCPNLLTPGNYTVTYTVGVSPQCGAAQTRTITVAPTPIANAGPT